MIGTKKKIKKEVEYLDEKPPKTAQVINLMLPHDQRAWSHYRGYRKTIDEQLENRSTYAKTVREIFNSIAELMLEYEGGVFLEEYGYFYGSIIPWKNEGFKDKFHPDPLYHTKGYQYTLQLNSNLTSKSCIGGMVMDRTFTQKLSKKFYRSLYAGFRPKLNFTMLESLYSKAAKRDRE